MSNIFERALDVVGQFVNRASGTGKESQQAYNERMANTQYQRTLQDIEKAGLNPSILYGQGTGHSSASSGSGGTGIYNAIGGNINSLIHAAVELHEDASPKNKNAAYHTANQMIMKTMSKEIEELRKIRQK